MANDWIIDVLADLKTYAAKNGLSALAGQLDDATLIAATEIASTEGKAPETANWEIGSTGRIYRTPSRRENA